MANSAEVKLPEWVAVVPQDVKPRPGKRSRVALACQRCKTRKQKCNGANPCSKCQSLDLPCNYVIPQKPMPFGKNQYIKCLEKRVAELEMVLAGRGMSDPGKDHWRSFSSDHADQSLDDVADTSSHTPGTENEDRELDWQDDVDNVVSVLRSLSMDANGTGYIGGSSHVAMGKLFGFLGGRASSRNQAKTSDDYMRHLGSTEAESDAEPIDLAEVTSDIADRLLTGYMKHIATRFPVVYSVWIRLIHDRRLALTDVHERAILHLVYASAGRFLETAGESGPFFPKRHYASALGNLAAILDYDDLRSVSALMLMAVYCLRNPVGPGAWIYSRMAMLVALNLGLHRKTSAMKRPTIENELRKRLFWAAYAFDRQISIPMGRPFAISDRDIDVPLPVDMDENTTPEEFHRITEGQTHDSTPEKSTSLSSFLQIVRIRRIESDIQQTIYRVDATPEISSNTVDGFLQRLEHWKTLIPLDASRKRDLDAIPFDGYDVYMVYFFKCKRLLLYPQISKTPVIDRYLKECAIACAGVCGAYKRLHQAMSVGYSNMALQTVFMAGLTLVYCIWISPDEIFDIITSNGIHDCSIILFVIAERIEAAKKYRNAFEVIRQRVVDLISDGPSRQPRQVMSDLVAELEPSVHRWEVNRPYEVDHDSFEQFSHIITEMSGGLAEIADPFSRMDYNTGAFGFPTPSLHEPTTDVDAAMPSQMKNPVQDFEANMAEFDYEADHGSPYNDGLSPWFSAATGHTASHG